MPRAKKTKVNKSAFIRTQPASASAKEVVATGKKAGVAINEAFVYAVRSAAKAKGSKRKPGRPKGSRNAPKATKGRWANGTGSTDLAAFNSFAEAVVRVGGSEAAQRFLRALEALGI